LEEQSQKEAINEKKHYILFNGCFYVYSKNFKKRELKKRKWTRSLKVGNGVGPRQLFKTIKERM